MTIEDDFIRNLVNVDPSDLPEPRERMSKKDLVLPDKSCPVEIQRKVDFDYCRDSVYSAIQVAVDSLMELKSIAENSKDFEAISKLVSSISSSSKELINFHKSLKELEKLETPVEADPKNVTNNNLIVTTQDLIDMIKDGKTMKGDNEPF